MLLRDVFGVRYKPTPPCLLTPLMLNISRANSESRHGLTTEGSQEGNTDSTKLLDCSLQQIEAVCRDKDDEREKSEVCSTGTCSDRKTTRHNSTSNSALITSQIADFDKTVWTQEVSSNETVIGSLATDHSRPCTFRLIEEETSCNDEKYEDNRRRRTEAHRRHMHRLAELLPHFAPSSDDHSQRAPAQVLQDLMDLSLEIKQNVAQQTIAVEAIHAFAHYLGMDVDKDQEYFHIAEWAMTAPLPSQWSSHFDSAGNEYFYSVKTKTSQYEHPMDRPYQQLYQILKSTRLESS